MDLPGRAAKQLGERNIHLVRARWYTLYWMGSKKQFEGKIFFELGDCQLLAGAVVDVDAQQQHGEKAQRD